LNLGDGQHPGHRQSERGADDACLRERRVDYPLVAVLLDQTGRRAEDAAQPSDVKAEQHDAVVPAHLLIERVVDRLDDVAGWHCRRGTLSAAVPDASATWQRCCRRASAA